MKADPNLSTLLGQTQTPKGIIESQKKRSGSRYYKCAFQVNPYAYCITHSKDSEANDEADYNQRMAQACVQNGIEVVGITDHFRVDASLGLADKLSEYGITVFVGFEANSSEGVHLLCLFPQGTTQTDLSLAIGACDISDTSEISPMSKKGVLEILKIVDERGGISIAAHVTQKNGLLTKLDGLSRANIWKSDLLYAAAIPETRNGVPIEFAAIIKNTDQAHKRDRPLAFINASDVSKPTDFDKDSSSTILKMSDVSLEGLRQCFLDHKSRVRLHSDAEPDDHSRIVAVSWEGGLLDEQCIHLNSGLNVLVGGRGAGKSTIIESIRYAFGIVPRGKEAQKNHESMMRALLGIKSSVSVLVYTNSPSPQYYLIERAYGQENPKVKDKTGSLLPDLKPHKLLPALEIYGQHEISELTRDKEALADILTRFVGPSDGQSDALNDIAIRLKKSREEILSKQSQLNELNDELSALPALNVQLKQFEDTDLVGKLSEKTSIQVESQILELAKQKVVDLKNIATALKPSDLDKTSVFSDEEHEELPNRSLLNPLQNIVSKVNETREAASANLEAAADQADLEIQAVQKKWAVLQEQAEERYNTLVKELKAEGYEPERFVSIKEQVDQLKPKESRKTEILNELAALESTRENIIDEWETADREAFHELSRAAKKVSRRLKNSVKASIKPSTDLTPIKEIFARYTEGSNTTAITRLEEIEDLSLAELARNIRKGSDELVRVYNFTENGAVKIASAGNKLALEIEECRLPPQAVIELNVGSDKAENWKELDSLSAGQRATAVLMLLLLDADAPLIVDQPEDDLDNQFIVKHVVETMREAKETRQFLFSSHNPNIPVLGDAEQIIGLTPKVLGGIDQTIIDEELSGAIDTPKVKELITTQLEGGDRAFRIREKKYGF